MENQKAKNEARIGGSGLNDRLERLIDGDVTCWGIDDVVAYGIKVAAMERGECADICDKYSADKWALYKGHAPYSGMEEGRAEDYVQGQSSGSECCGELIRERSNVELTSPPTKTLNTEN